MTSCFVGEIAVPNMADCVEFHRRFLIFFVAFFWLSLATVPQDQQRKITIKSIPCPTNITGCNNTTYIIHAIAESMDKQNSMHYLWSVIGSPTIIAAYFDTIDVNVSIHWDQVLINNSTMGITFTPSSLYITALVIPAIYEFQDEKDELYYTFAKDGSKIVKHGFQDEVTHWEEPEVDHKNNVTTFRGKMLGGTVIFQCNASALNDRESILPHQQFSSNSTVFTLTLDRLTNLHYKKYIRFIFELVSFSKDDSDTCVTAQKSLDDEHTPAVFKTIVINSTLGSHSSYSAWKPVAYLKESRKLSNQIPSFSYFGNQHQFISQQCDSLPTSSSTKDFISIVPHLLGKKYITNRMNISFGQRKDGWYEGSSYLTWSAMVGYGTPIKDEFSTLVWLIIFIGFGAPMLLILITMIYIIIKKVKAKKATSAYGIIN